MILSALPSARAAILRLALFLCLAALGALAACAQEDKPAAAEEKSRAELYAEDFDYFKTTLNERHPDMYHELAPEAFGGAQVSAFGGESFHPNNANGLLQNTSYVMNSCSNPAFGA